MRVKLAAAMALSVPVALYIPEFQSFAVSFPTAIKLIIAEALSGFLIGFSIRLFLLAIQTAGSMAAQATSLAQLSGGAFPDPLPGIGHLMSFAALTLLMINGFAERSILFLANSYQLFPFGEFPAPTLVGEWGASMVSRSFSLAFQLTVPFVLLSMLYNITLGAINRAMPQLMVAIVGAPVITGGSLVILLLALPSMLIVWSEKVQQFMFDPTGLIR